MKCQNCSTNISDETTFCPQCGFNLNENNTTGKKLNLIDGSNGFRTILEDGAVYQMDKKALQPYRFRFGVKHVAYFIEKTRIIQQITNKNEINFSYLPYEDILRVHLFIGKTTEIRISSLSGCLHLATKKSGKAVNFVDMIEVASAKLGNFIKVEIGFKMEFDMKGGGIGVGF